MVLTILTEGDAMSFVHERVLAVAPPGQTQSLDELVSSGACVHAFLSCMSR